LTGDRGGRSWRGRLGGLGSIKPGHAPVAWLLVSQVTGSGFRFRMPDGAGGCLMRAWMPGTRAHIWSTRSGGISGGGGHTRGLQPGAGAARHSEAQPSRLIQHEAQFGSAEDLVGPPRQGWPRARGAGPRCSRPNPSSRKMSLTLVRSSAVTSPATFGRDTGLPTAAVIDFAALPRVPYRFEFASPRAEVPVRNPS
jgi:hypothetical protein